MEKNTHPDSEMQAQDAAYDEINKQSEMTFEMALKKAIRLSERQRLKEMLINLERKVKTS